jgi:hypothetical protein
LDAMDAIVAIGDSDSQPELENDAIERVECRIRRTCSFFEEESLLLGLLGVRRFCAGQRFRDLLA